MKFITTTAFCAAMATLVLAGCASPPTRYYTLAAPLPAVVPAAPAAAAAPLWIELAPLGMPERLARPQLVVRPAGDGSRAEVEILEQHRWASSFENELRDALASGIAARLGALDGTRGGRPAAAPVTRIAVQVRQFDAVEGSKVEADLGWTLRRAEQPRSMVCRISLSEPVVGTGIDAVAQGAQRLTANVSAAIARSVAALQQNPDAACPI
ncbi:PqiC family protein [Variovorax sp. RT4R15]|uniref:PqiC family protein n=1 Tax=Variovorax sp. RT4R15 TaxID=3443737 RepID=UPI003F485ADA